MIIKIDEFLTPEQLGNASEDFPATAIITAVNFIEAEKLPFESKEGKYQLILKIDEEDFKWLANKTSLRAISKVYGKEAKNWIDKSIKLWVVSQLIQGKMKRVIYAIV